jgi:UTP--glucose-1-phosphate uridylyltransferase
VEHCSNPRGVCHFDGLISSCFFIHSIIDSYPSTLSLRQLFKDQTASIAAKSMLEEIKKLVETAPAGPERQQFQQEMQNFYSLFTHYLSEKVKGRPLDWEKIQSPKPDQIVPYAQLAKCPSGEEKAILGKLAVLKLNGGLGTTMGCVGPKSVIEVREGLSFLDLTVRQIETANALLGTDIPLILMNSFNTDDETKAIIKKYEGRDLKIITFNQSRYPRIIKDSLMPLTQQYDAPKSKWYPPGHGDLYNALANSGVLDRLLAEGKEYLFVSNVDNLGATVDTSILRHMMDTQAEFLMEVTDKTKADIKGGTLIDYEGRVRLLEIAQVPPGHVEDFKSIKKFKIFNTNNLWLNLKAVKRIVQQRELDLEIIVNLKTEENTGEKVIQLETAVGAAIKHFQNAHGINVPRSRFLPVKSCSDLFIVQSDLYELSKGELIMNPKRQFATVPIVKLGDHFKKVTSFLQRFKSPPKILELDHLTVTGDVYFGSGVTLKGTVIIVANPPSRIDIPSGAVLEDKVVTGDLRILDH